MQTLLAKVFHSNHVQAFLPIKAVEHMVVTQVYIKFPVDFKDHSSSPAVTIASSNLSLLDLLALLQTFVRPLWTANNLGWSTASSYL